MFNERPPILEQRYDLPVGLQRAFEAVPGKKDLTSEVVERAAKYGLTQRETILRNAKKKEIVAMNAAFSPEMCAALEFQRAQINHGQKQEEAIHHLGGSAVLPDVLHHQALRRD